MKEIRYIFELLFVVALWLGGYYVVEINHWNPWWMAIPILVTFSYRSE